MYKYVAVQSTLVLTIVAGDDCGRGVRERSFPHNRYGSHGEAVSPMCSHLDRGPRGCVDLHQFIGEAVDCNPHHVASEDAIVVGERRRSPRERDHTRGQVGGHYLEWRCTRNCRRN